MTQRWSESAGNKVCMGSARGWRGTSALVVTLLPPAGPSGYYYQLFPTSLLRHQPTDSFDDTVTSTSTTCGSDSTSSMPLDFRLSSVSTRCAPSAVDPLVNSKMRCSPATVSSSQPTHRNNTQFFQAVPVMGSATSQSSVKKCAKAPWVTRTI